ncbi:MULTISPECIES: AfsR/SARP family transcriptional regulator [unclassified Streptomyces]|uniref:AfsR/SARP family transcriptional regulator n=1 Tax=unclassified Streptomyces TaxID=2593676 RepID=UPI000DAE1C75|nr:MULTISPECIES: BTAD domain-containing putative transcriptional regulator [unclassified Streptomyces]PZT72153.1 transcriptional regulator [Streptomyces sp. AC1-42T]PZT81526.1 transcriptional regulator [Streptomyces sp. AC1-42W]
MLFRILGPVQVGPRAEACSSVRRALLTALLLRRGRPLAASDLMEILWDEPPGSATANIRSHLTGLRRDLDRAVPGLSDRLHTHRGPAGGYVLRAEAHELDLAAFTGHARRGRQLLLRGEPHAAVTELEAGTALWRGPFGHALPPTRWFGAHAAGLDCARLDAYQDLFTACVLAGHTELLAYRIESVIAEAPYRQRLWTLLAATHCVTGDAAGALAAVERCASVFAEDLGLALPPEVEAVRTAALAWDREAALRLVAAYPARTSARPAADLTVNRVPSPQAAVP